MTGLCLLDRNELKFECSYQRAGGIRKQLFKLGFVPEKFFDKYYHERIATLGFVDPARVNPKQYSWVRIRKYYHSQVNEPRDLWLELREKNNLTVHKEREAIDEKEFKHTVNDQAIAPLMFIDYQRQSFDIKEKHIRVTLDTHIRYYSVLDSLETFKFGKLVGEENITLVKIKFWGAFPDELIPLLKGLKKPRSKLQRGIKFLKKKGCL